MLLTYAEALAELGTITQADLDKSVNLLRARAGVPSMNLATANGSPDPVLAAKHPNVPAANKPARFNRSLLFMLSKFMSYEL